MEVPSAGRLFCMPNLFDSLRVKAPDNWYRRRRFRPKHGVPVRVEWQGLHVFGNGSCHFSLLLADGVAPSETGHGL